jgi:MYXO-CTERM domain-containing protein
MQRSTRFFRWPGAICLAAASLYGCAAEGEGEGEPLSVVQAPIEDGANDDDDLGVLRVVRQRSSEAEGDKGGQCSGVVIAPDLVLTARHCVSALRRGASLCEDTTFYPAQALTIELVALSETLDRFEVPAENVSVPTEGGELCGYDVALVRVPGLERAVRKRSVHVFEPRFDGGVRHGESYRAVGLGAYNAEGNGVGTRRERGDLSVDCAGKACQSAGVGEREWRGSDAICSGDSGGPAIDDGGRLIGIVSRANSNDCSKPIYASVYAWRHWLSESAFEAARLGGYSPPAWAGSTLASEGTVSASIEAFEDETSEEAGCSAGGAGPRPGGWAFVGIAVAALAARRRRSS